MRGVSRKILRNRMFALAILAGAIVFFVYDLVYDAFLENEFPSYHFFIELLVFIGVSIALTSAYVTCSICAHGWTAKRSATTCFPAHWPRA